MVAQPSHKFLGTGRAIAVLAFLVVVPASAETISGRAQVIDGNTIEIGGRRIRLFGIDAPEGGQTCVRDGLA